MAGLSVARDLRRFGHAVTIYDAHDALNGLNTFGIVPFRLAYDVAVWEAEQVVKLGVDVKLKTRVGVDVKFDALLKAYDALVVACGMGNVPKMGIPGENLPGVWDAIVAAGATPVGLGARDTLRLEVCFHLYGNDMDESRNPIEAGLGWCCKEATGFIGSEAVAKARQDGTAEKLVPFVIEGQGIPRQGNPVIGGGEVTSGTFSPSLERGIGMAYVSTARADEGTEIEIDVRGRVRPAVIMRRPLYRKEA